MIAIDFDLHAMSGLLFDAWVVSEYEFFGFEIEEMWFFEDESDGFFLEFSVGFVEILDDFEVGLFVFEEEGFYLGDVLESVDAEDLVEELSVFGREVLEGVGVDATQTR